jgi:hypothetical protein
MDNATIKLTLGDKRAVATLSIPGMAGATATRSGHDDRDALASTLRALADIIDSRRLRATDDDVTATWVRVSMDVDVKVPEAEAQRAEDLEQRVMDGSKSAADELLELAGDWVQAAFHLPDNRDFQSFSWSRTDECEDFNLA